MQNEKKVDVIVLYKDKVPKTPRIFGSTYENEKVLKSLPIKTMTVPISEFNRLKKDPNVLSVSLDQEVELAESELKEISIQELELQRSLGEYDWNNDMIKGFDARSEERRVGKECRAGTRREDERERTRQAEE